MSIKYIPLTFYIVIVVFFKSICGISVANDAKPLILTPYIQQDKIKEARKLSEVDPKQFNGTQSYSGFFTVNQKHNSTLFFWFFPSETDYLNAPLILWLDGGPGTSSLISIFSGIGPLQVNNDGYAESGKYSCSKHHSVIYIDNPAGTGYSFSDKDGYAKNQTIISGQLYEALMQFFQLFPEIQTNDFYVFGESYGGKYVPALSYRVHLKNQNTTKKINLKGLIIGNSWSDPKHQSTYSEFLYQIGFVDYNSKLKIKQYENTLVKYIDGKEWKAATDQYDRLIRLPDSLIGNVTGYRNIHNFIQENPDEEVFSTISKYVQKTKIKNALHIGSLSFNLNSEQVFEELRDDIMKSVAPWLSELLDHYRVMIFTGQLDIMVAYPMTVNFLRRLRFKGADQYHTAVRQKWFVGETLAGYVKEVGNLTEVLVRNAGHMVHFEKPYYTLNLITKFTRNEKF